MSTITCHIMLKLMVGHVVQPYYSRAIVVCRVVFFPVRLHAAAHRDHIDLYDAAKHIAVATCVHTASIAIRDARSTVSSSADRNPNIDTHIGTLNEIDCKSGHQFVKSDNHEAHLRF